MRRVLETDEKPECVFSATAHSTEWISTKTRLPLPRPNQISASGSSAIAGSGLNIEVSVSSRSVPMREVMATHREQRGQRDAARVADQQDLIEVQPCPAGRLPTSSWKKACSVALKVGNSSGLSSRRA